MNKSRGLILCSSCARFTFIILAPNKMIYLVAEKQERFHYHSFQYLIKHLKYITRSIFIFHFKKSQNLKKVKFL
jgi:hypothetical protein